MRKKTRRGHCKGPNMRQTQNTEEENDSSHSPPPAICQTVALKHREKGVEWGIVPWLQCESTLFGSSPGQLKNLQYFYYDYGQVGKYFISPRIPLIILGFLRVGSTNSVETVLYFLTKVTE